MDFLRKPGNAPDGDMLPLAHIGIRAERGDPRMSLLTKNEQRTLMSMWSIARFPLMFGGHLPDNDQFTLDLITNDEVLAVNQKTVASKELLARESQVAWVAELPGLGAKYLAVFNIGDATEEKIKIAWSDLGLPTACTVRDLWAKKHLGRRGRRPAVQDRAARFRVLQNHGQWRSNGGRSLGLGFRPKRQLAKPGAQGPL